MIVNIVGLQHRNLPKEFTSKIGSSSIYFVNEKNNQFDKFAVKCVTDGKHFGYIEKENSKFINALVRTNAEFTYKIIKKDEFKVTLKISINQISDNHQTSIPSDSNNSGIYRINFEDDGVKLSYIGQSTNIQKRLQSHINNLKSCTHVNERLQLSWISNPSSFKFSILYLAKNNGSAFEKQIELFEKELHFIEEEGNKAVNAIDGDLVFTKDSLKEFDSIDSDFKNVIKKIRLIQNHRKLMLGKLILDLKIIDRVNYPSSHAEVKDSNVTTWLNKKRYGNLDYRPQIRYSHNGASELINAILKVNEDIKKITIDNVFVDDFKKSLFKKKNSYDTCKIKNLNLYINILKKYQLMGLSEIDISKFTKISTKYIDYDSSLLYFFDKSFFGLLFPYNN
jgi:hypothetical protein